MKTNEEIRNREVRFVAPVCPKYRNMPKLYTEEQIEKIQDAVRKDTIAAILENDNAWNLVSVLAKVTEAAEILMSRDYDGHGWELISTAIERSKEIQTKLNSLK